MILTCPACATRYFVADGVVGAGGKSVRCAGCHHRWMAYPGADTESELELGAPMKADAEPQDAAAEPEPVLVRPAAQTARAIRQKVETQKTVRSAIANGVVWAGIAASFAAIIAVSIIFRVDVVRLAPRTASAYAAVGLPVNAVGLVFEGVSAKPGLQDGHDALVVSGAVRNVEKRAVASPLLAIKILDKAGHQIAVHMTDPGTAPIAPGQVHNFVVSLVDPPAAANDVEVAFGAPRKLPAGAHLAPKPAESAHPGAAHEANPGLRGAAEAGPAETPSKPTPLMDLPVEAKPVAATSPYAIHAVHG